MVRQVHAFPERALKQSYTILKFVVHGKLKTFNNNVPCASIVCDFIMNKFAFADF